MANLNTMDRNIRFFKRDISWLSFNYRVLLEADDDTLPLYERINFISIYSSNLEEFYKIRVADHRAVAAGIMRNDDETADMAKELVDEINEEVNRQLEIRVRIYEKKILPALRKNHIIFYQGRNVESFHQDFVRTYFKDEIFPFMQPIPVMKDHRIVTFLRDNRLYLAVRASLKGLDGSKPENQQYFVLKLPAKKVPRFIELPRHENDFYYMFLEDIVKANINSLFPGYNVDCSYCLKISRDADIMIEDTDSIADLVEQVKKKIKKRKIGAVCRFVYDRSMPTDFLDYLIQTYGIETDELVPGDKHLSLEDLRRLPNPFFPRLTAQKPRPMKLACLNASNSVFDYVEKHDLLLCYPYHSFDHFVDFLREAAKDPLTKEIMVTQYRVAEQSHVIDALVDAAHNGKAVTVFVELKARFDEENNLITAERMESAGIRIIYSLPGLKVHAKVAFIHRGQSACNFAYIGTGNFNEETALLYADCGLFTCNNQITRDLYQLFRSLKGKRNVTFHKLLVARFNLVDKLNSLIDNEIELAKKGKEGRIILKMNALQDQSMIERLYEASQAGVQIDLIIRGICCLVPGQSFSRNIRVTRIVDSFLEHARVWFFGNAGHPKVFCGSPDWMKRNLYKRIEVVTPILDDCIKGILTDMLEIQLSDNKKACYVNDQLENVFKPRNKAKHIRAQYTFYDYLKKINKDQLL